MRFIVRRGLKYWRQYLEEVHMVMERDLNDPDRRNHPEVRRAYVEGYEAAYFVKL